MSKSVNKHSSLELMRIVSMFFIIVYHIIQHSEIMGMVNGTNKFVLTLICSFFVVHVDSFILLTGYFQSDKDAKLSKVISIFNATWFYKLLCALGIFILVNYFGFINNVDMTFDRKLISLLPLDRQDNWYINCYLLIYIFSPFINALINKLDKKQFQKLIAISFISFSILGTLVIGDVIPSYLEGRSILTFLLLYFIGAYLKKYPLEETAIFSKFTDTMKKYLFLIGYIFFAIIALSFMVTSDSIMNYGKIYQAIGGIFSLLNYSFLSPIVIIASIFYFLFFKNMKFNSKIINYIGGTTFGIYLLHENIFIRDNLYKWLGIQNYATYGIKLVGMLLLLGLIIFIISMIIEIIRKGIYKFCYKRKFAAKLREKIKDFIKSLGLNINY